MQKILIQPIPNQSLSIQLDGYLYDIKLQTLKNITVVTLSRDGVVLVSGLRVVSDAPLLPFLYLFAQTGNFFFFTENGAYPYYDQFGITQQLVYFTYDELNNAPSN